MPDELFQQMLERARNARAETPCWCGLPMPFEACHRDRESRPRAPLLEVAKAVEAAMRAYRRACMHYEAPDRCSGPAVRSHSIQRAALELIAERSHVIGFEPSFFAMLKNVRRHATVGLREASVITAFCSTHDSELFAPLESRPYTGTAQQMFLLAYRALCLQVFANGWQLERLRAGMRELDCGLSLVEQVAFQRQCIDDELVSAACLAFHEALKGAFDSKLRVADFSGLNFLALELLGSLPLAACCARVPAGDFEGAAREGLGAHDLVPIMFSLIPGRASGIAVFSWLGDSPGNSRLAATLMDLDSVAAAGAVARFAFTYAENSFLSPRWWAALSPEATDSLMARMYGRPDATSLSDDGLRIETGTVGKRLSGRT